MFTIKFNIPGEHYNRNTGTVNKRIYIGSAGNTFKERFRNHKTSFSRKEKKNSTELSK